MNDLIEIRDRLIRNGFPELMGEDVQIQYSKLEDALLENGRLTHEGFYIEVDQTLRDAPVTVMEGGIAHELVHIVTDRNHSRFGMLLERLVYRFYPRYRILDERNTDLQTVIRGYGKQLLVFLKYSEERGFHHYREDGFSVRELEQILSAGR